MIRIFSFLLSTHAEYLRLKNKYLFKKEDDEIQQNQHGRLLRLEMERL